MVCVLALAICPLVGCFNDANGNNSCSNDYFSGGTGDEYVDLGLPSGTLWKNKNEAGGFYTYKQAVNDFGSSLPTKEQWEELQKLCIWTWKENGYMVIGRNGNTIFLPAYGFINCDGNVFSVGSFGYYWSSTPSDSGYAWGLLFYEAGLGIGRHQRCWRLSVRLVH